MAIDSLQTRIMATLDVQGGYGVFDKGDIDKGLLRRSLLWRRGEDSSALSRIDFQPGRAVSHVPSWSWMAYIGGIDYIRPKFGAVRWEKLISPWSRGGYAPQMDGNRSGDLSLIAKVQGFELHQDGNEDSLIVFDSPQQGAFECVVLGKDEGEQSLEDKKHYLLVVKAMNRQDGSGKMVYERVGAGCLPGRCIKPGKSIVTIE